jgi:tRNA pseudouridine38-40 synthase
MEYAAQTLLGEHDFSAFRASSCQALSPIKKMVHIGIQNQGAYWRFDFEGSAFLHHMVRNIMGCLVSIGTGKRPKEWMKEVLESRSRTCAAPTFSPAGLYFLGATYDAQWGLPDNTDAFGMLPVPGKW